MMVRSRSARVALRSRGPDHRAAAIAILHYAAEAIPHPPFSLFIRALCRCHWVTLSRLPPSIAPPTAIVPPITLLPECAECRLCVTSRTHARPILSVSSLPTIKLAQ